MTDSKIVQRIRWAQYLLYLGGVIWLAIGIASLVRLADNDSDNTVTLLVVAVLMLGNVGAMLLSGVLLGRQERRFYYFALAVLAVNIVLSVTDEFGIFDLVTMLLDMVIFGLVVDVRRRQR